MTRFALMIFLALAPVLGPAIAIAQSASINFGGLNADADAPVEMTADKLSVSQNDGTAVFEGNVVIGQGDLRLSGGKVVVTYKEEGGIDSLQVTGGVTLVTATEAAEAQSATYSITNRNIVLRGDVLLTQGRNALMANTMRVNLATGNAVMEGRVRTVLQTGDN